MGTSACMMTLINISELPRLLELTRAKSRLHKISSQMQRAKEFLE